MQGTSDILSRNKRSLSGTSIPGDIDEPRRKEPRLEFDDRPRDSNAEASSSTLPPVSSAQSFNTSNVTGVVTNVGGHIINGDYIVNLTQADKEKAFAEEVCRWLAAPETSRNYHAARETNHAHTGSWFICGNAFARWKAAPDHPLWLCGSPGCGKTIICSSVIETMIAHCKEQPSSACAYFFFDSRNAESELSLHEKFIRSLILQLWHQLGRMPAALKDMYGDGPSHPDPSLAVLEAALQTIIGEFQHAYIIIDALDECADRHKLLRWVKGISCWRGGRLHMLLSSRRERDIEDSLAIIDGLGRVSFAGGSANPDIVKFLNESLVELTRWDYEIRTLIKYTLLEGADGSFRWVALQLKELIQCSNLRSLRQQLRTLPKDIEETYQRLLLRASKCDDLRRFLQWMAFSERPIALEELAEVVTIDFQASDRPCYDLDLRYMDVKDVLTVCSGFVTEFEGRIKLAHMSVKDYLVSESISSGPAAYYSINASQSQCLIAQTCLAYLLRLGVLDSLGDASIAALPLARYAAEHWTSHLRGCSDIRPLQTLLSQFFLSTPNSFTNWIGLVLQRSGWFSYLDQPEREKINERSAKISTPLYIATLLGLRETVHQLLACGTIGDAGGFWYFKALYGAACEGYHEIVKLLLEHAPRSKLAAVGLNLSAVEESYGTAFITTALGGRDALTSPYNQYDRQTLWYLPLVFLPLLHHGVGYLPETFGAALQEARRGSQEATVRLLLHHGANVNGRDYRGGIVFEYAVKSSDEATRKLLSEHGNDINAQGEDGVTPLQKAAGEGHVTRVRWLLKNGANVNAQDGAYWATALHNASMEGHETVVRVLLDSGADVNVQSQVGATALHCAAWASVQESSGMRVQFNGEAELNGLAPYWAVEESYQAIIRLLLDNGADVNAQDKDGAVPLHKASEKGHTAVVKQLLQGGAYINGQDIYGARPLHNACGGGYGAIIQLLLDYGADVNARDGNGAVPLHKASEKGHTAVVQLLLQGGADVNARDRNGARPLHNACGGGYGEIIRLLLDYGADVNAQDKGGAAPLHMALENEHAAVIVQLPQGGADVHVPDNDGRTSLHFASVGGFEVVRSLVEHGADVNIQDEDGATALHIESQRWREGGSDTMVRFLVEHGADINILDGDGVPALCLASKRWREASWGDYETGTMVRFLVEHGADINIQDEDGATALHIVSQRWRKTSEREYYETGSMMQFLVEHGADVNILDEDRVPALHIALQRWRKARNIGKYQTGTMVRFLAEHGADINIQDEDGATALHIASQRWRETSELKEHYETGTMVRFLVKHGADVKFLDKDGATALHIATEQGEVAMLKYLFDDDTDDDTDDDINDIMEEISRPKV